MWSVWSSPRWTVDVANWIYEKRVGCLRNETFSITLNSTSISKYTILSEGVQLNKIWLFRFTEYTDSMECHTRKGTIYFSKWFLKLVQNMPVGRNENAK